VSLRPLYLIFVRALGLIFLVGRTASSEDDESPVLRHEVAVLRRTNPLPPLDWADRQCSPPSSLGDAQDKRRYERR
jgi:putative transposase